MSKEFLRRLLAEKRKALNASELNRLSGKVIENIQLLDAFRQAETAALYKAIGGEVDLEPLFEICWTLKKRTAIPVFNSQTRLYEMAEITESTEFTIGNYGIAEPVAPNIMELETIDLMAVPGVGFDLSGNRLGRGGGYYDRMLAGFHGTAAGIGFDFQVVDAVPVDPHDLPVDYLVTETKSLKVQNER